MADGFGLDKSARNAARAETKVNEIEPLDPLFPYRVMEVDWDFFEVAANPPTSLQLTSEDD